MTRRNWFAGKAASHDRNPLIQSFLRFIVRSRVIPETRADLSGDKPATDSGTEPCWTATLHRGDSLPPFRLSILGANNSSSPMRLEPCRRAPRPSRPAEL